VDFLKKSRVGFFCNNPETLSQSFSQVNNYVSRDIHKQLRIKYLYFQSHKYFCKTICALIFWDHSQSIINYEMLDGV